MSNRANKLSVWLGAVIAYELVALACFAVTSRQENKAAVSAAHKAAVAPSEVPLEINVAVTPAATNPGGEITVQVKTKPQVRLSIEAQDVSFFQAFRLQPLLTGNSGEAAWHFSADDDYRADRMPIIITADQGDSVERKIVSEVYVRQKNAGFPLGFASLPSTVVPGQHAAVTIKTASAAKVRIEAQGAGFAQAGSLLERTADKRGLATWEWRVPENYPADIMPVIVTSDYKNAERKIIARIAVVKKIY